MNYIRKTFVPSPPGQEIHAMATIDKKHILTFHTWLKNKTMKLLHKQKMRKKVMNCLVTEDKYLTLRFVVSQFTHILFRLGQWV